MPTIPQFLALDINQALNTTSYLRLYRDGDRSTILGSLPTTVGGFPTELAQVMQFGDGARVVRYKNLFVACVSAAANRGGIFVSSDDGATWTQVVEFFTDLGTSASPVSQHLHVIHLDGEPTLCYAGCFNNDFMMGTSTDGTNWTFKSSFTDLGTSSSAYGSDLVVDTKLYLAPMTTTTNTSTSNHVLMIDFDSPEVADLTRINGLDPSAGHSCLCYFNGEVYNARSAVSYATTDTINIYSVTDGLVNLAQTITHTSGTDNAPAIKWDMFTDGTNMYLFSHHSNSEGWILHEMNSALAVTARTAPIPAYMQQDSSSTRLRVLTDQVTDPTNPQYFIFVNIDTTQGASAPILTVPWHIYQWVNSTTAMTLVGAGGSVVDRINWGKRSQRAPFFAKYGEDTLSPGIEIINKATQANGTLQIQFQIFGQDGTETVDVRGFYADLASATRATSLATISNASHGSIVSNVIQGLTADNATTYQVTWEAPTDGIADGDRYSFNLEVALQ